ncbi:hypothetical protein C900_03163 [Fulvivirga imtechensis AK7]|uniref:DAGKc domain-containing protein n=1 Tax=Fulvivirga imtechensis AK7 TaxID=1237149 RepID=L8JS37_9BACT|nr:diacylglycerol kinase family protein [Fulvivirga imtechensis]ELR71033.1 hypothetical protein C900_03163 [Fulvivirga imtechensis AK7]
MLKVGFVVNGKKRVKDRFFIEYNTVKDSEKQFEFQVAETTHIGEATGLSRQLIDHGCSYIISVGGDGTLHEVVNGIMQSNNSQCILGTLMYGTANDFSRTVPAPKTVAELLRAIKYGATRKLDIGLIELPLKDESRYFINIASIGMSAEVVKRVNNSSKSLGPELTFFSAIVRTFMDYSNQPVACHTPGWQWSGKANSLVVANGKYFGNGMCIAPDADPADGQFSVMISGDVKLIDYLRNVVKIKRGKKVDHPQVLYRAANELHITSASDNCFIEADGEFIGTLPVNIFMKKEQLNLLI